MHGYMETGVCESVSTIVSHYLFDMGNDIHFVSDTGT